MRIFLQLDTGSLFEFLYLIKKPTTISQKIRYSFISNLPGLEEFIRFPVSRFLIWNRQEFNTADYKFRKAHYCHGLLIRQELTWRRGAHRTTGVEAFRSLQLFRTKIPKNANDQSPIKDLSIYIGIFFYEWRCRIYLFIILVIQTWLSRSTAGFRYKFTFLITVS